jgi:hypothetical protein
VINGKESQIKLDFQTRNNLMSIKTITPNNNQLDQDSARRSFLEVILPGEALIWILPVFEICFAYIHKESKCKYHTLNFRKQAKMSIPISRFSYNYLPLRQINLTLYQLFTIISQIYCLNL